MLWFVCYKTAKVCYKYITNPQQGVTKSSTPKTLYATFTPASTTFVYLVGRSAQ